MTVEANATSELGAPEAIQLAAIAACAAALMSGMLAIAAHSRGRSRREIARTLLLLLLLLAGVVACSLGARSLGWTLGWGVQGGPHLQQGESPGLVLLLLAGCAACTAGALWAIRGVLAPAQEDADPRDEATS